MINNKKNKYKKKKFQENIKLNIKNVILYVFSLA